MRAQALNDEDIFAHEDDEERGHSCDDSDESGEEGSGEENDEENDEERVEVHDEEEEEDEDEEEREPVDRAAAYKAILAADAKQVKMRKRAKAIGVMDDEAEEEDEEVVAGLGDFGFGVVTAGGKEDDNERVEVHDDDFDDIVDDLSDGEAEHDEEADRHRKLVAVEEDKAELDEVSVARSCVPLLSPCYFNAPRWACQRVSAQAPNEKWRPWPPRRASSGGCPRCLPR